MCLVCFFFNDTATTEIYTLSLHDALPIYELQFIRIYMRPKGGKTDYKEPLIIRNGNSVLDVCNKLHRKLRKDFRYGLVWGKSVKFGGQRVGLKHILIDEDVLTIIKTKGT